MSATDMAKTRLFDYGIWPSGFSDGVAVARAFVQPEGVGDRIVVDRQFPAAVLSACAGKPILEVIDHPVTRERYNAADVIERAFWDDEAQVSVFEIEKRRETATT